MEANFGKETTDRLRNAMRSAWRSDRPTLRSERSQEERETVLIRWYFGLAALAAEAEDPNWARKLSVEEAELAARYAPLGFEGFPAWMEALVQEHPTATERILGSVLTDELEEIAVPGSFAIFLQNISHAPAAVAKLFVPCLQNWLCGVSSNLRDGEDESAKVQRVERVIRIIFDHGDLVAQENVRAMALNRLNDCGKSSLRQLWLTTLMRVDPAAGVQAFERILQGDEASATDTAMRAISSMFGARHGDLQVNLRRPGFTPALLLRLLRLAYQRVSPSDDLIHEGFHRPNVRDEAQLGRSAILGAILDGKGPDAWAAKLEMIADPLFSHLRYRISSIAYEKAAEEVDESIMTEADAVTLDKYGETAPKTREDMFAVLLDRLEDLNDALLEDDSPRAAWAKISDETAMRQLIARELRIGGRRIYKVDQEAVTADEKETDIRLRAVSSEQQATIELKIGCSYSGRQLRDAIKDQLVKKYMAAESSRSGCLLVTINGDCTWEHPDTRERLCAIGLRAMLEEAAARIERELGSCLRIAIMVLDLRPRLRPESAKRG